MLTRRCLNILESDLVLPRHEIHLNKTLQNELNSADTGKVVLTIVISRNGNQVAISVIGQFRNGAREHLIYLK